MTSKLTWHSVLAGLLSSSQHRGPVFRLCQHPRVSLPLWSSKSFLAGPFISCTESYLQVTLFFHSEWEIRAKLARDDIRALYMALFYHTEIPRSCRGLTAAQEAIIPGLCFVLFPSEDSGTFFIALNDCFSDSSYSPAKFIAFAPRYNIMLHILNIIWGNVMKWFGHKYKYALRAYNNETEENV